MQNITIGRFDSDPTAQGVIRPADDSWQLVLDAEGLPHLYVRVPLDGEPATSGLLALDDVLLEGLTVRGLMRESFGGALPAGEEEAAMAELAASRAACPVPCPR